MGNEVTGNPNEIHIPSSLESALLDREAKLAKRCAKMGVPAPRVTITRRYVLTIDVDGRKHPKPMTAYVVEGSRPTLPGGWQIVASVEHHDTGNIVSVAPAFQDEAPTGLFNAPATCDHCGHNRRRARTVIVRDANGVQHRVGTNCLRDFTGHDLPRVWELDDLGKWDDEAIATFANLAADVIYVLAYSAANIRVHGYAKARDAETGEPNPFATFQRVRNAMRGHCHTCPRDCDRCSAPYTPEDWQVGQDALAWILASTEQEGYIANLRAAVIANAQAEHLPLIVSLVRTYQRTIQKAAEKAIRDALPKPEKNPCLVGTVTVSGVIISTDTQENAYGTRYVMTVRDDRGFTVWGSQPGKVLNESGQPVGFIERGDRITFIASVERSDRDESFGFFKRPRKAQLLATATAEAK